MCPGRLLSFLGHSWKKMLWDKFGTGRRDQPWKYCRYCGKSVFP